MSFTVMPGSPPPKRGVPTGLIVGGAIGGLLVVLVLLAAIVPVVVSRLHARRLDGATARQVAHAPAYSSTASSAAAALRGYYAPVGKHGKPLSVGQPWGPMCEPIRMTVEEHVPDSVYREIETVSNQARRHGIDITMEDRRFLWSPSSLYYPPGASPSTVERIGIFASNAAPQPISNGGVERLALGWDTALLPGGESEKLTGMQGTMELAVLSGHPSAERTAVRQVIALTQGIVATTSPRSGIVTGTKLDAFSPADIAAMQAMSGCGTRAGSVVAHTPTGASH
jgi:hypothetical protein